MKEIIYLSRAFGAGVLLLGANIGNFALARPPIQEASGDGAKVGGDAKQQAESAKIASELPIYEGASDKNISVSVQKVIYAFDKDEYLPKDKNWVQISLILKNTGKQIVSISDVKSKQRSGILLDDASQITDLAEPPDALAGALKGGGVAVAGTLAGAFIFPPLAIVGGVASLLTSHSGLGSWKKRMKLIQQSALNAGEVPPDTAVAGNVYVPATTEQKELMIFYSINGKSNVLSIPVSGTVTVEEKKKKFGIF